MFDFTCVLFYILQTGFLTRFAHAGLQSHLGIYYGLLILFLTNVSVIFRALAFTLESDKLKVIYSNGTDVKQNSIVIVKHLCIQLLKRKADTWNHPFAITRSCQLYLL